MSAVKKVPFLNLVDASQADVDDVHYAAAVLALPPVASLSAAAGISELAADFYHQHEMVKALDVQLPAAAEVATLLQAAPIPAQNDLPVQLVTYSTFPMPAGHCCSSLIVSLHPATDIVHFLHLADAAV
jgi:hypothetical protein